MNHQEREIFFELLRSALWEHEANLSVFQGKWNWSNLLQTYQKHSLLGIVADTIMKLPIDYLPSDSQQSFLMMYTGNLLVGHQQLNQAIKETFTQLEDAGCSPILLKGQGLATLYPKNCIRSCGDVDVYIGPKQIDLAKQVINKKATREEISRAEANELEHHYEIKIDGVIFEIHRYPGAAGNQYYSNNYNKLSVRSFTQENTARTFIDTVDDSFSIAVPSSQVNAWYVFNHLVQHFHGGGVGLRQFCDWMMVLKNNFPFFCEELGGRREEFFELDSQKLTDTLNELGLSRAWRILSGIIVYQLGFPAEKIPLFDEKMAQKSQGFILDQIIEGENFRFGLMPEGRRDSNFLRRLKNSLTIYYKSSRSTFVISRTYPFRRFGDWIVYGAKRIIKELF